MPKSGDIINEIRKNQAELEETEREHNNIRADIILGPMDDVTPWTETGLKMKSLREKIERQTFELGQQVLRERGR